MSQIVVATLNRHKLAEYRAMLGELYDEVLGLEGLGAPEPPEETGATFEENALLKVRACAGLTDAVTLADDSGLEVDALGGFPGVRSNRWAGPGRSDAERNEMLLRKMQDVPWPERTARFVCVIAAALPDGTERTFRGALEGMIAREPRGSLGFGYDPVFYVPGLGRTVGELPPEEKNRISHRARALAAARSWLVARTGPGMARRQDRRA